MGELVRLRKSRPKCVPTAEIFGHLPDYLQCAHASPEKEEGESDDEDLDSDEVSPIRDVLSPLKKQERKRLRILAGVKPKTLRMPSAECSAPRTKISLPEEGKMRCLWGGDCIVEKEFDYTKDTIKGWKDHIASRLTSSSEVWCMWDGCNEKMKREYLFKHIVTHEVRFKQLCPRGCGVAFRDDNLARHLKVCHRISPHKSQRYRALL